MDDVAQRGCGISILADIQNQTGYSPELPAPADPALSKEVELDGLQKSLPSSASWGFCFT